MTDRTPEQIIGTDALMQLIFEGYAVVPRAQKQGNDFECENCIGMPEHGCYCAAMGADAPGGPSQGQEEAIMTEATEELIENIGRQARLGYVEIIMETADWHQLKSAFEAQELLIETLTGALTEVVAVSKSGADTISFLTDLHRVAKLCATALAQARKG